MRTTDRTVLNPSGIHARPAATFVKLAATFRSAITIANVTRDGEPKNAKSMLAMMGSGIEKDHLVRLVADGEDEDAAIDALAAAIDAGLGEAI
jgi:phosphotransferase system HPr (HPr) family protein